MERPSSTPDYPPPPGPPPQAHRSSIQQDDIHFNNPFVDHEEPPVSRIPLDPSRQEEYYSKFDLSSYRHPHEIPPPQDTYSPEPVRHAANRRRRSVSFAEDPGVREFDPEQTRTEQVDPHDERAKKRRGIPSNMMDLHAINREIDLEEQSQYTPRSSFARRSSFAPSDYSFERPNYRRLDSTASNASDFLDPDDPRVTGVRAQHLDDHEDLEKNTLRQMDYRSRRKHLMRVKIEFNVVSMAHRQEFLLKLAKALMAFGAPSHRIESQLIAAGRILEVQAEFIHLPGVIICSFGDQEMGCSETHFVKCGGRLSLGALHKVHVIYRAVVHDEVSAKNATEQLEELLNAPPLYSAPFRILMAVLSESPSQSSSLLPLEALAASEPKSSAIRLSPQRGSLGFGLQIGSDFYLLFDPRTRRQLDTLASSLQTTVSLSGSWVSDNGTVANSSAPLLGTWTFTRAMQQGSHDIKEGCYRPTSFPWYLQPFPPWTAFIIVPVFSLLSSLANLQPLKSKQLPVMVIISCCSYASNKVANHYIFNRSDVVSAIGAFTVGVLGNVYSRKMGGTAFTSMVTGVLFLVPSGLSQAGGITANGNGIDIGGAMIAVTIGITVGLFMSQALVYMFGTRKNAAVFSF
ncbi:pheromone-regulated protein prm10 [Paramarasmius palmivorus]|uniref:Pheromone-regulated protein prm10 n=1 Tax=Paramarasmius palmivorus TaxID=297713 RepID=A0AAW0E856_9AGAR